MSVSGFGCRKQVKVTSRFYCNMGVHTCPLHCSETGGTFHLGPGGKKRNRIQEKGRCMGLHRPGGQKGQSKPSFYTSKEGWTTHTPRAKPCTELDFGAVCGALRCRLSSPREFTPSFYFYLCKSLTTSGFLLSLAWFQQTRHIYAGGGT